MPTPVYLSLGSNVGNREANLKTAIENVGLWGDVIAVSGFYETEPVEFTAQPWFLNCAVQLNAGLTPEGLMAALLTIERGLGRRSTKGRAQLISIFSFSEGRW